MEGKPSRPSVADLMFGLPFALAEAADAAWEATPGWAHALLVAGLALGMCALEAAAPSGMYY